MAPKTKTEKYCRKTSSAFGLQYYSPAEYICRAKLRKEIEFVNAFGKSVGPLLRGPDTKRFSAFGEKFEEIFKQGFSSISILISGLN